MDDNTGTQPSPLTVAFGRQLAAERTAKGYSLRQLSELSGVSVESLTRYEHAKRDVPLKMLGRIAAALGMSGSDLIALAEDRAERETEGEPVES